MGNTGNSETYPYGIRTTGDQDEVYNRVTGKAVAAFARYGIEATQKINDLVAEFKAATAAQKRAIVGEAKAAA